MKERPILFSGPMVRAILDGRKGVTRRVVKPQPEPIPADVQRVRGDDGYWWPAFRARSMVQTREMPSFCPYGTRGDLLWVKESFRLRADQDDKPPSEDWWKAGAWYEADRTEEPSGCGGGMGKLRPSIFMPRWASRLTLEITDVRVERLQQISGEDAIAEGVQIPRCGCEVCAHVSGLCPADASAAIMKFAALWDEINGARAPWASNPWVWVIEFRRVAAEARAA